MENIELLTGTVAGKTAVALHGHGWCEGSSAMASGKPFEAAVVGRGGGDRTTDCAALFATP